MGIASLLLSLSALQAPVTHQDFSARDLRALARDTPGIRVLDFAAPTAAQAVGFWWRGALTGAEAALVDADGIPGPWWPLAESADLAPEATAASGPAGARRVSGLVHAQGRPARAVWLRGVDVNALRSLAVVWVPRRDDRDAARGLRDDAARGLRDDAASGSGAARGNDGVARPPVWDRASWGADPPQCSPGYCTTTHVAMHHTASASEYASTGWAQCAANVRATQDYHMYTRGWCDVGYHYLICVHGEIFEGRAGGDDVRGAHDGYNCGSMGVAMMGYFHAPHSQTLTQPMRDAFVELGAWKCAQQGVDPLGSGWYAGYGGVVPHVYGHRDVSSTACPGDLAYAELPALRAAIDQRIRGGGQAIVLDNGAAAYTGTWSTGTSSPDKWGADYRWASTGVAPATAAWTPAIPRAGRWEVQLWWPAGSNRNPATRVGLRVSGAVHASSVNQQILGGRWNALGTVWLPAGTGTSIGITNAGAAGHVVVADALRLVPR